MLTLEGSELVLDAVLGNHAVTRPITTGDVTVKRARLRFHEYRPTNAAFPEMVRSQKFDVCEMAIMTAMLAHRFGKPIGLLPTTVLSRFQQPYLVFRPGHSIQGPADLSGAAVGVRSYTVTTGAWIRGILEQDYGVRPSSVHWVSFEPPHVDEYVDPSNVTRADGDETLMEMLVAGTVDAAIIGAEQPLPEGVQRLFPPGAEQAWYARYGVVPINHMVCVTDELSEAHPEVVRGLVEAIARAKADLPASGNGDFDPFPIGIESCRDALQMMMEFGVSQGILEREVPIEELFAPPVRDWL